MRSEHFDLRLTEPRTPGAPAARTLYAQVATVIRGPMLRVVNVRKAMTARRNWGGVRLTVQLTVADDDLPQNAEPLAISFDKGIATIGAGGHPADADVAMWTDAPAFAQLYAGEILPSEAVRLGRARIAGDLRVVDDLFRVDREFRLLDEF